MKRHFRLIILLSIIFISTIGYDNFLKVDNFSNNSKIVVEKLQTNSNGEYQNTIVFFNKSSYTPTTKTRFQYYGGVLKPGEDWNGIFNNFSGFAGFLPVENISNYKGEFSDINLEKDEIVETQMNYVSMQSQSVNSTWYSMGLKGDTDSSIAVLDSGVDPNHTFLQNNIIGWQNFVNGDPISDDNGHGTFISSVITGTGILPYNSSIPSEIIINKSFTHLELFNEYLPAKNYSFKICSFNASKLNSIVEITSTSHFLPQEIDKFWFELYYDTNLVNFSLHTIANNSQKFTHKISQADQGIYDLYIKYHKKVNVNPYFSFNSSISFFPENYVKNYNHFTGIANNTNIAPFKIVNQSGMGYISDLISGLASVIQNRETYKIISVCLSIGTMGTDTTAINKVIDEVINNNILVVIAAGNYGLSGSNPLNTLALNKNAIVVGATNDVDQVASYSSMGKEIDDSMTKPDIVAPGGSKTPGHRSVISATSGGNKITASYGTSISTAIVSAALNLLIEAKWNNWATWNSDDTAKWVKILKSILLLTATETNLQREDDAETVIDEGNYSPTNFNGFMGQLKDIHEGYGRLNTLAAIDALTKSINISQSISSYLTSSEIDPLSNHIFVRRVNLLPNTQYVFNLSHIDNGADFDIFLYSNGSSQYGEPILLQSSRKWYGDLNYFYFTPLANETNCIIAVKAIEGEGNFTLDINVVDNIYAPDLKIPEINYLDGAKNDTIISLQEYYGNNPAKNYSIDNYWFYIEYFDNDSSNVPPQQVNLHIIETNSNYSMNQLSIFELSNNYTEGVVFRSPQVKFPRPGVYSYYFTASDGFHQVRYPISGSINITIEFPTDSLSFPYTNDFNTGLNGWSYNGTGWDLLTQYNSQDNRSILYDEEWSSVYFGREHDYPSNYTYQPYLVTNDFPNGTLKSPLFNLTCVNENTTHPYASFGLRTSINSGDYVYLQINLNWTGWTNLRTYSNQERDWFLEEINLTQYIENFVQFRFIAILDEEFDSINYKGFMVDYFSIFNYTNVQTPEIEFNINDDVSLKNITKFTRVSFQCRYHDDDDNYPEFVYLEMNDINFTMINLYGDWNASYDNSVSRGIIFVKSLVLGDRTNLTFRFHVSDGINICTSQWYNQNEDFFNFIIPEGLQFDIIQDNKFIGREFSDANLDDFYITGTPIQKELSLWLGGDNTWHPIVKLGQNYVYGGLGQSYGGIEQGYGIDWEINLITHPILLGTFYNVYLEFFLDISLQNEFFLEDEELDRCIVSLSKDYGDTWILLKEYYFDDEFLYGNESIDLSLYSGEEVMIKFTLESNDIITGLGYGWLLSNIYIGYDKSTDFIDPLISIINPSNNVRLTSTVLLEANISDNVGIDTTRLFIYLNNKVVDKNLITYKHETNSLTFNWDTTLYSDGTYEVRVLIYDTSGNTAEEKIVVFVENGILNMRTWGPWILIIGAAVITGVVLYVIAEKKGKSWVKKIQDLNAEKVRLKFIDKDQAIKRIELIESEEEMDRPLILYCKYCRSWFHSKKNNYICPICEHDQLYIAYNCINCGKWYFKEDEDVEYYCKKCSGVKLIKRDLNEVKDILGKEGILLREYKFKGKRFSILDK